MNNVPFNASKHRRGAGGKFAATGAAQAAAAGRPTGPWAAGPVRKGSGAKGAKDPRVVAMQQKFNALGITDERGQPLLVDGIDGNHTTAAVKKWQTAHGLPATGEVDAKTMLAILTETPKPAAPKKSARSMMSSKPARKRSTTTKKPNATKAAPAYVDRGRGFSRFGNTAST